MKNIQELSKNNYAAEASHWAQKAGKGKNSEKTEEALLPSKTEQDPAGTFVKSEAPDKLKTYKPDTETINALKAAADNHHAALREMVTRLLTKQGLTAQDVMEAFRNNNQLLVPVDQETRDRAAELVGEDGELGWKAVSESILNFAKAISGGDPGKIDMLRKATEKGFKEAEKILGELPEVSQKTYDAVMKGFDEWKAETDNAE